MLLGLEKRSGTTPAYYVGLGLSGATAIVVTLISSWFLADLEAEDWDGWRIVAPMVVVCTWLVVLSWLSRRTRLAAILALLALLAPWGYFYPGPLAVLSVVVIGIGESRGASNKTA